MPNETTIRVPYTIPLTGEERWHIMLERSRILRSRLHGRAEIDWIEEGKIAHEAYQQSWPRHASVPVLGRPGGGPAMIAYAVARS